MAKLMSFKCPLCGAQLTVEDDRKSCFCTYCGTQIPLDDEVKRVEITKNININQTSADLGRIKEAEFRDKVYTNKINSENQKAKYDFLTILICLVAVIFMLLMLHFMY